MMVWTYRLATVVVTGLVIGALIAGPARARPSQASIHAQEGVEPQLIFTALQLADHVRYAVTLLRPLSATVANVRVEVALPAGTELAETLQTPNRSVFLGAEGNVLSWAAPSYEPGDPVDVFTFRLTRPLGEEAQVRATWEVDGQPRVDELRAAPGVEVATAAAGEVILRRGGETGLIGETGVRLEFDPESELDGIAVRLRKLGPEANPPAGVGSPWWCAALAVEGLPAGAGVFVVVPLRQPLPPGLRVDLFAERGGSWEKLSEQGHATADGQFVAFHHPGGTVAAGVLTAFQPIDAPAVILSASTPKLQVSFWGPTALPWGQVRPLEIHVREVGGAAAQLVSVVIVASPTLAFLRVSEPSGGFSCQVRSSQRATCDNPSLAGGTVRRIFTAVSVSPGVPAPQSNSVSLVGSVTATLSNNNIALAPNTPSTTASARHLFTITRP